MRDTKVRKSSGIGSQEARILETAGSVDMSDIVQDMKYALRAFRSSPGLFAAIVLTLGVAVGGNATVFSWIEGVVLRPMAVVPDQERIVAIAGIQQPGDRCCVFSYPDYVDYRDGNSVLDGIIAGELISPTL